MGGGHQNTSWNGFYTDKLRDQMPPYFSTLFRARPPLEYVFPADGLVAKNYKHKGY